MPTRQDFLSRRPALTINISGYFGSGKSLQAHSFPKCYTVSCDPAGLETLRQPRNEKFLNNLIHYEDLHNESSEELKKLFRESSANKPLERDSIYGCLAHARELAAKGEVETLVIDGFTYLVDMKWQAICDHEEVRSGNTGNRDSQAMYRNLGFYLHRFVASDLMTMASRHGLNVVLTTHLKRESEDTVKGSDKASNRAKKVMTQSDLAPLIEGGFRNKLSGLVGGDIYLIKELKGEGANASNEFTAICDTARALGTIILGKNRWGLPARLPLTNKSLYEAIMDSLQTKGTASQPPKVN